jgi:hypothetical protein
MAFQFSDKAASGILHDSVPTTFPAGSLVDIRAGADPGPGAVDTGTLLATVVLPGGPWGAGAGRGIPKAGVWSLPAIAAGVAGHFRLKTAGDGGLAVQTDPRVTGSCGQGAGDMSLDNTNIAVGQVVTINIFALSVP